MSNGELGKVSQQDIQLVQNLIERCIQLYMSKREAVDFLSQKEKIEPDFIKIVWQRLEEENKEFFGAYRKSLILKKLIARYHEFLERELEFMRQACPTKVASISLPSVPQTPLNKNYSYRFPQINAASILQPSMQAPVNMPGHATEMIEGAMIKPGSGYAGYSHSMFAAENNLTDPRNAFGVEASASVSLFAGGEWGTRGLNESSMDPEMGLGSSYAGDPHSMFVAENNLTDPQNAFAVEASVSLFAGGESGTRGLNESSMDPGMGLGSGYAGDPHSMFAAENNLTAPQNAFGGEASVSQNAQIPRNFSLSDLTAVYSNSTDIPETFSRCPYLT